MRISLLQRREPFAPLLEATLSAYWSEVTGRDTQVHVDAPIAPKSGDRLRSYRYLNAIYHPGLDPVGLQPIRNEFGFHRAWWRRTLQRPYVDAALSHRWGAWFADGRVHVLPEMPRKSSTLVVPGNSKIRLLDHVAGTSTSLRKAGFPEDAWERELEGRAWAKRLDLPVPAIREVRQNVLVEQYLVGTPANRHPQPTRRANLRDQALRALGPLVAETQQGVSLAAYVDALSQATEALLVRHNRHTVDRIGQLRRLAQGLRQKLPFEGEGVHLAHTHGDLQDANILVDPRDQMWLIDWEMSGVRQSFYDAFVLLAESRGPAGLNDRLKAPSLIESVLQVARIWDVPLASVPTWWPDLFLWEELNWHLQENANEQFLVTSPGLIQIMHEIEKWLNLSTRPTG